MDRQDNIIYEKCPRCAGAGKLPSDVAGAVLRGEREAAGLSLAVVAGALDISTAYLGDLERGNRDWSNGRVEAFRKVVKELGDE